MATQILLGDLQERPDGSFDGWCWAPDRPEERLIVDLLVNDTLAISMVAAIFRRDLQACGYGDGRHGFVLRLPANTPGLDYEALITARERRSGQVFGRLLRAGVGVDPPGGTELDDLEQAVAGAWNDLAVLRPSARPGAKLRATFADLAARMLARARGCTAGLPDGPPVVLPALAAPALTVAFRATDAARALACIEALAPALALVQGEMLAIDSGVDARAALLPGRVRNLRYVHQPAAARHAAACNTALAEARGAHLVWLGDGAAAPSAAALLALADAVADAAPALWLGPPALLPESRAAAGPPKVTLPARLDLVLCLDRALRGTLGPLDEALDDGSLLDCADLAMKARLLGVATHAVAERAAPAGAQPGDAGRAVRDVFQARWGLPAPLASGA